MTLWAWLGVSLGIAAALYAAFLAVLAMRGRSDEARAWARLAPDCAVVLARLLRDPRVERRHKLMLGALAAYLAFPLDLVPDVLPVVGVLDDAVVAGLVLRRFAAAHPELIREHWPGPESSLALVLRLAGADHPAAAP
jgi:uncharacterized membrane protein YkvA (DUF1232 family)